MFEDDDLDTDMDEMDEVDSVDSADDEKAEMQTSASDKQKLERQKLDARRRLEEYLEEKRITREIAGYF
ncbi:MAG: hypothetical protein OEW97_07305 [Gammaproteobacteria bacterium]|nr:hypothetical protein [Gammaproteobacteria bacterium]